MSNRNDAPSRSSILVLSAALLALAAAIAVGSLLYGSRDAEAEFGSADGQAEEMITEIDEGYQPWFSPLVGELPGEVESGLFALQAGLGGIVLGSAVGWYAGRQRGRKEAMRSSASAGSAEGEHGSG